jgi:hypothetical protein
LLSNFAHAGVYKCKNANGEISFSDHPCATGNSVATSPGLRLSASSTVPESKNPSRDAYTKDIPVMVSPDAATLACFNYVNTTARFADPSTTRLLSSSRKWVTVKSVGARQLLTIKVTSKNEGGMYVGIHSLDCLMMGDHTTVNTGAYELL